MSKGTARISWEQATALSVELGHTIGGAILAGERPLYTRIAAIPRGGSHTTNIVSRMLGMTTEQVLSVSISRYDSTQAKRVDSAVGQIPSREAVKSQDILLIDDILRSGETAKHAEDLLLALGATSVGLAVLFDKSPYFDAVRTPDFSAEQTDCDIQFAWNEFDGMGATFLGAMEC
jgi:hypoxanthine phosphoribosyltransferase